MIPLPKELVLTDVLGVRTSTYESGEGITQFVKKTFREKWAAAQFCFLTFEMDESHRPFPQGHSKPHLQREFEISTVHDNYVRQLRTSATPALEQSINQPLWG